jgi:hypothetical protein
MEAVPGKDCAGNGRVPQVRCAGLRESSPPFLGTQADNVKDMSRKGRNRQGEKHGSAKLTLAQVRRIKTMLTEDKLYMSEIAREFEVSETTIRSIKTGKTWRKAGAHPRRKK